MKQENKILWADNLRVIATISAIFLHVSAVLLSQKGSAPDWWVGNIYDSAVRFCVPVFVMLTGALLLPKEYELTDFFKRRFFRVVLPFIFWSLIYVIFNLGLKFSHGERMTLLETSVFILSQIRDGSSYHLWFVYMIIGIYLFIPIIGKWIRNSTEKEILYFLFIWVCVMLFNLPPLLKFRPAIDFTYFTGYIGYLVLGYYLTKKTFIDKSKVNLYSVLLIVSGIIITIYGTYFINSGADKFQDLFYNYLTPNVLMVSAGVFLYFKDKDVTCSKTVKIRDFLSKYSFGIYLVHILILSILSKFGITGNLIHPVVGVPLTTVICLIVSAGVIYAINKFPYGKYISG